MSGDITRISKWAEQFADPKVLIEDLKKNIQQNYVAITKDILKVKVDAEGN